MRILGLQLRAAGALLLSYSLMVSVGLSQESKKTRKVNPPGAAGEKSDSKKKSKKADVKGQKSKAAKTAEVAPKRAQMATAAEVMEPMEEARFYRVLIASPLPDDQEREIARMTDEYQASRDGIEDFLSRKDRTYAYRFLLTRANTPKFLAELTALGNFTLVEPPLGEPVPDGKVRFEVLVEKSDLEFQPRNESKAKPPEYNRPVSVSPAALGGQDDAPKIFYSISEGRETQLGPFVLKKDSFLFEVAPRQGDPTLIMRWPQFLAAAGEIQVLGTKGNRLWSKILESKATKIISVGDGKTLTRGNSAKAPLNGGTAENPAPSVVQDTTDSSATAAKALPVDPVAEALPPALPFKLYSYEAEDLDSDDMAKWSQQGGFRICLASPSAKQNDEARESEKAEKVRYAFRYCSRRLKWSPGKKGTVAADSKTTIEAFLNGKPIPLAGVVNIEKTMGVNLRLAFKTGDFWEWKEKKPRVDVADIVGRDDGTFEIKGRGISPWGAKAADFDNWSFEMKGRQQDLSFISPWGLPLTQKFQVPDNLVAIDQRPVLHKDTVHQTYQDKVIISGFTPGTYNLAAAMGDVQLGRTGEFEWTFPTGRRGTNHRRSIRVWNRTQSFVGTYDIHRGFPGELSVRLSSLMSSAGPLNFLGELAGTYWFESIAGWENTLLSRQRWGLFGSYTNNVSSDIRFTSTHFELKYRLSPGLWNRNESVGLIAVNHGITYRDTPAQLVGGGLFWARTAPDFLDSVMNVIPWFRYPKYVEAKIMVLPMALGSEVSPSLNLVSFFQGKMIVTPRLFLEAGISVRRYSYTNNTLQRSITSFFASGTLGVGYLF